MFDITTMVIKHTIMDPIHRDPSLYTTGRSSPSHGVSRERAAALTPTYGLQHAAASSHEQVGEHRAICWPCSPTVASRATGAAPATTLGARVGWKVAGRGARGARTFPSSCRAEARRGGRLLPSRGSTSDSSISTTAANCRASGAKMSKFG